MKKIKRDTFLNYLLVLSIFVVIELNSLWVYFEMDISLWKAHLFGFGLTLLTVLIGVILIPCMKFLMNKLTED